MKDLRSLLFCFLLVGGTCSATEVYINGVNAKGLTNMEFKGCTVKFDDKGTIHITAPGVKVLVEGENADAAKLSEQYFATLTLSQGAAVPIKIVVNGIEADTIKPGEKTKITEITKFLKKGTNKVLLMAAPEKNPISVQVLIGTGKTNAGSVELIPTVERQVPLGDKGLSETFEVTAK